MPPSATARGTPSGRKLKKGFRTLVTLSRNPTIALFEVSVTPPGIDGGDAIDNTTMHNTRRRTKAPRDLIDSTDMTFTAAYDPKIYTDILAQVNVEQTITCRWSDGSTLAFFGFLQKFEPGENTETDMPTATVTIVETDVDPTTGAETDPVMVEVAGT